MQLATIIRIVKNSALANENKNALCNNNKRQIKRMNSIASCRVIRFSDIVN